MRTKRMFRLQNAFLLAWLVLVCGFGVLIATRLHQATIERSEPFGRYSKQQIVERTEPLCREISPGMTNLVMRAEQINVPRSAPKSQRYWTVDCELPGHEYVANFMWNADTGDLRLVGASPGYERPVSIPVMSRDEAVRKATEWLGKLDVAKRSPTWRAEPEPYVDRESWVVNLRGATVSVWIKMEERAGKLL